MGKGADVIMNKNMNSITATYPGFQALPKGVKRMLLESESYFFDEAKPLPRAPLTQIAQHQQDMDEEFDAILLLPPGATPPPPPPLRAFGS
jgi:hypothetical protein